MGENKEPASHPTSAGSYCYLGFFLCDNINDARSYHMILTKQSNKQFSKLNNFILSLTTC